MLNTTNFKSMFIILSYIFESSYSLCCSLPASIIREYQFANAAIMRQLNLPIMLAGIDELSTNRVFCPFFLFDRFNKGGSV